MKPIIIIMLTLMSNMAQAQIYKCEAGKGEIIYQDTKCSNSSTQSEVSVQKIDPNITLEAQEKLQRELQQRAELEAARNEQALKERKIQAIEAQTRSNEELANAARVNAYAVEQNTEAVRYGNQRSNVYYYNPPRNRPEHRKHGAKPYQQQWKGAKASIGSSSRNGRYSSKSKP